MAGLLPSQDWKMKRHKQKWYAGDTISVGIGQGYNLATPLQLAFATAILAGNGTAYRPHLVKKVLDNNNEVVREIVTQPLYTLNLNAANLATVRNALIDVTRPGGTAAAAGAGAAYTFAGKTGTSQVVGMKQGEKYVESKIQERHRDHALFVAYAPAESPKIALSVLVENGGHGGSTAAPIARLVMDYFLLGKLPEESAAKTVEQSGDEEEEMPQNWMSMIKLLRLWHYLTRYVDGLLLAGILLLMLTGLVTLYSATDASLGRVTNQATNMLVRLASCGSLPIFPYSILCALRCLSMQPAFFCCWA